MPFLGTMPPVSGQANLQASDSSPKMTVGAMLLYADASGNLSWVRYAKADNATVKQHLAVKHASNTAGFAVVTAATGDEAVPGVLNLPAFLVSAVFL